MENWIIYYEDGSSFTSSDGNPEDAPRLGVLLVANIDKEVGKILHHRADFYIRKMDQWLPADKFGLMDYLLEPGHYKIVLWGRITTRTIMHKVYVDAFNDTRMNQKTGLQDGEEGAP